MNKLFAIDKDKLTQRAVQYQGIGTEQGNERADILFAVADSLVPIESEKKEERCTKCNGTGKVPYLDTELLCDRCYCTGKEPRKEEFMPNSAETVVVHQLRTKLSKAIDCLENVHQELHNGDMESAYKISGTCLAEIQEEKDCHPAINFITCTNPGYSHGRFCTKCFGECPKCSAPQEEKCLCSNPPRITHPNCPVHPIRESQQKPQWKEVRFFTNNVEEVCENIHKGKALISDYSVSECPEKPKFDGEMEDVMISDKAMTINVWGKCSTCKEVVTASSVHHCKHSKECECKEAGEKNCLFPHQGKEYATNNHKNSSKLAATSVRGTVRVYTKEEINEILTRVEKANEMHTGLPESSSVNAIVATIKKEML